MLSPKSSTATAPSYERRDPLQANHGYIPGNSLSRRKVFYLLDSLHVGGTETQAVELALRLPSSTYDVTLGCLLAEGPLLDRLAATSVKVCEFHPAGGLDSFGGVYQLLRLAKFLRRYRFDVVHTHDLWSNLMGVPAARLAGIPVIISSRRDLAHFEWYRSGRRIWLRRIQNLSNVVLANAEPIRQSLISDDGFAAAKLRVIHNGVDMEKFRPRPGQRSQLLPGIGEGPWIVQVGNMHSEVKGHGWLVESAPAIVREFPQVRFVLVGDGELRPQFERQVAELGMRANFAFLGRRDDVAEILACCNIAVLPSQMEGLPNAILEYMASGLPTVATRVGGSVELIEDGVNGLLVTIEDRQSLSAALLSLLRQPERAAALGANAREFVAQRFSFERLIREVDQLYSELLAASRPA